MSDAAMSLFYFDAPTGVECCICEKNLTKAAKALCTTGNTLSARGKKYASTTDALPTIRAGLLLAESNPFVVYVRMPGKDDWVELSGDRENVLLTDKQRSLKKVANALEGSEPMKVRTIKCDDETWSMILELGGSKWIRQQARHAYKSHKNDQ